MEYEGDVGWPWGRWGEGVVGGKSWECSGRRKEVGCRRRKGPRGGLCIGWRVMKNDPSGMRRLSGCERVVILPQEAWIGF